MVRLPLPIAALARRLKSGALRAGDINEFLDVDARTKLTVPLMASTAACGFPSPADDYLDSPLDYNELLVSNPAATFAVRISGESMTRQIKRLRRPGLGSGSHGTAREMLAGSRRWR